METITSLQSRLTAAQQQIYGALRQGRLDRQEADVLTAQVAQLQKSVDGDSFDGNGLTHGQVFGWAMDFVNGALQQKVSDSNQDFGKRFASMEQRITASHNRGSLTDSERNAMLGLVRAARVDLANSRVKPGGVTAADLQRLSQTLDGIDVRLSMEVSDDGMSFAKRTASMRRQIQNNTSGKLTDGEQRQLLNRLDRFDRLLADAQKLAKAKGRPLEAHQREALAQELVAIEQALSAKALNPVMDTAERVASLNELITDSHRKGLLLPAKTVELRRELQTINATFGRSVDPDAASAYGSRLQAFEAKVRAELFWS